MGFLKNLWTKFKGLKKWQKFVFIILVLWVISIINENNNPSIQSSKSVTAIESPDTGSRELTTLEKLDDSNVKWVNYSPAVKQRIADLIDAKDCSNLQSEFDIANQNNDSQRNRTGESNSNLIILLDEAMRDSGCY